MHSPLTSRLLLAAGALGVLGVASCGSGMSQPSAPSASSLQVLAVEEPSEDLSTDGSEDLLRILTNDDAEPWIPLPLLAAAPAKHKRPSSRGCPSGMLLVSGNYCPKVEQRCLHWLESTGRYAFYRCAEYEQPARCLSTRRPVRFCMDREEYTPRGSAVPASRQSWTMAKNVCEGLGKRVCLESEWNFACEGEEMRPYPYGFTRKAEVCNADRVDLFMPDGSLRDLRLGARNKPRCVSPFGVHHMSGNLEEWTTIDGSNPPRAAMKGAYWQPSRNHCRAAQTAHDTFYNGVETGFRCCKDTR